MNTQGNHICGVSLGWEGFQYKYYAAYPMLINKSRRVLNFNTGTGYRCRGSVTAFFRLLDIAAICLNCSIRIFPTWLRVFSFKDLRVGPKSFKWKYLLKKKRESTDAKALFFSKHLVCRSAFLKSLSPHSGSKECDFTHISETDLWKQRMRVMIGSIHVKFPKQVCVL